MVNNYSALEAAQRIEGLARFYRHLRCVQAHGADTPVVSGHRGRQ